MRDRTRRASAIAFVALLLVSTVAVGIPLASMSAAAAPSGMVALDGSSITEEVPSGESIPASASDFESRIYASDHAESMSLTLTTGSHADEVMNSDAVRLDGEGMVLVLADDENHGAREIAIEATVLSNSLGYVPKWAVGTHEDGSTWKRPVTYEDGYVRFEVPHFSSNAVSFESEISISASAASNGTSFSYDVSDLDAASDPTVNMTGTLNTETDTESGSGDGSLNVASSESTTNVSVDYELDPTLYKEESWGSYQDWSEMQTAPPEQVTKLRVQVTDTGSGGASPDLIVDTDGDQISNLNLGEVSPGDNSYDWYTFYVDIRNADSLGFKVLNSNIYVSTVQATGGDPSVDLSVGGQTQSVTGWKDEPATANFSDVSTDSPSISASPSVGSYTWTATYNESSPTIDPGVVLNDDCTVVHDGTLNDGETVSLTANESCLQEGTNEVVVEVGDGSLSDDAPDPKVALTYSHDTLDRKVVDYGEEQWTVRYATSKTFASERSDAWLNTTFEHEVVAMRDVEIRWNESGDYVGLGSSYYQLDGNDVAVDLAEAYPDGSTIPANTTAEVRLNGSRVDPHNMTISVEEASKAGDPLESRITVDTRSEGAHIDVGPTADGSRIHYTEDESWTASSYVVITPSEQSLHLPKASAGDAFTVQNLPTAAETDGDVRIEVKDAGESPSFAVSPGPNDDGDEVEFTHYATTSGVKYNLLSLTNGIVRDSETANSPVTLVDDDSAETLAIGAQDSGGDDGGGDGDAGGVPAVPGQFAGQQSAGASLGMLALIGIPLIGLAGAVVVYRRRGAARDASLPVRAVATVGRAVSTGIRTLSGEPRVVAALAVLGGLALVLTGAIQLPPGSGLLLVIAGLPLVTYLVLRRLDSWSPIVFGTVSAVAVVLGLQLLGADPIGQVLDALGPGVLILALGLLVLAYQGIQAAQAPEEVNEINIGDGDA